MTPSAVSVPPLQQALVAANAQGQFIATVLTDGDGLPIAAATQGEAQLAELLAAVAPLVHRMVQRSNERAGLSAAHEVIINNADHTRLICRFFSINAQPFILACVTPRTAAYRRVMNQTTRAIQTLWAD
jgi:predicted regulator of Ras-like GTPase activity (Roadblock/LC7/MglB family)